MTQLEAIKELINPLPQLKIAFVGQKDEALLAMLNEIIGSINGEIKAFIYGETFDTHGIIEVTPMVSYAKIFRTVAREYELLILNEISHTIENRERLYKTAFKALENSGDLLVIEKDIQGLKEALEATGFVAFNEIETDEAQNHLLSAKKMHGWGHGL